MGRANRTRLLGHIVLGLAILCAGIMARKDLESWSDEPSERQVAPAEVADVDGHVYSTVTIGDQVWMAENLRVVRYRDGTAIPHVRGTPEWSGLTIGAYCLPEHDPAAQSDRYGVLYNFRATQDSRGLCPGGWHVPTAEEWRSLIDCLGGTESAGGRMKDTSSGLWRVVVPGTTNESGFSALPAGGRGQFGSAAEVGYFATWWSSTPSDADGAWHWGLYPEKSSIRSNPGHRSSGFSVRCVRD